MELIFPDYFLFPISIVMKSGSKLVSTACVEIVFFLIQFHHP